MSARGPAEALSARGDRPKTSMPNTLKPIGAKAAAVDTAELKRLKQENADMKANNDTLEKEREFYFMKLQYIEQIIKLNGFEEGPLGGGVLNVMYAGEDDQI